MQRIADQRKTDAIDGLLRNEVNSRVLLDKNGFARLRRAVPIGTLRSVLRWCESLTERSLPGWLEQTYSDLDALDPPAELADLTQRIAEAVERALQRRCAAGQRTVIVKAPREGIPTPWHQDEAYLGGPAPFDLISAWVPLHAVDEASACMRYVPVSKGYPLLPHAVVPETQFDPIPTLATEPPSWLVDAAITCTMGEGDIALHVPHTLHASFPNRSASQRSALVVDFIAAKR